MAAGHQLKKMAQSRANAHHGNRWIDYVPKHRSLYTLVFSVASLLLFCFLFYDMQSSPASLLVHAGRELGALKVQVGDSYLFSSNATARSSPLEIVLEDSSHTNKTEKGLLSQEDLMLIKSEFEDPNDPSPTEKESGSKNPDAIQRFPEAETEFEDPNDPSPTEKESGSKNPDAIQRFPEAETVLEEVVDTEGDFKESKQVSEFETEDGATTLLDEVSLPAENESNEEAEKEFFPAEEEEQNHEDGDVGDVEKKIEEMIAATEDQTPSIAENECDWSKGKWVYDESYPIYKPNTCPFMDGGFRCVENGRPSSEFQKWRWQPHGCDLPRFDAKDMLERMRGSRMAFVGDSIGRNNWESMLCMLSEVVANKSRVYEVNGEQITKHSGFLIYRFEDYDCTVEYYRSPHLVPQGRAAPHSDPRVRSSLKLDAIDWYSSRWSTADIVIFNSGHWWTYEKTLRGGNYFQEKKTVHMNMSVGEAFTKAMKTVARYVEKNMDPAKSQVFFRSYAPVHFKGGTWDHGGTCNADTKPLQKFPFVWEDRTANPMISDLMGANVKNPVHFLNITYLSDLRPDGHSSIWQRVPPSPKNHQDCSHWCLPGVPDTWNEILFATLLKIGQGKWGNHNKMS